MGAMDENLRREMQALLDGWAAAIVANDADRIDAYAEEDWTLVGTGGAMPRRRFLDLVRSGRLTHEEMRFEVLDVWDRGDVPSPREESTQLLELTSVSRAETLRRLTGPAPSSREESAQILVS